MTLRPQYLAGVPQYLTGGRNILRDCCEEDRQNLLLCLQPNCSWEAPQFIFEAERVYLALSRSQFLCYIIFVLSMKY